MLEERTASRLPYSDCTEPLRASDASNTAPYLNRREPMKKFDVEVRRTVYRHFFIDANTREEAEAVAKEQVKGLTDLNIWREYQNEFEVIAMELCPPEPYDE
jgi:hypothetical protein